MVILMCLMSQNLNWFKRYDTKCILKPRKIFGIESQGMLLTTEDSEGSVHLLRPGSESPAGTRIQ